MRAIAYMLSRTKTEPPKFWRLELPSAAWSTGHMGAYENASTEKIKYDCAGMENPSRLRKKQVQMCKDGKCK